ncbi:3602_t:CDS:2, partial [Dentiscutata heterogama]
MKEESNYSQSPFIKLFDKNRTFYCNIIKEGTYPLSNQCYYTKYSKHPIPNNYIIKTQHGKAKHLTKCPIQYKNKKPQFIIQFGLNFTSKKLNKIKAQTNTKTTNRNNKISKISGPLLFGLTLLSVKNIHQTLSLDCNPKIHPFKDLSNLTKCENEQKEAIVKSLDCGQITRDAYQSLARIEYEIPREGAVSDIKQKINLKMKKQIPLSLVDILQPIVFEEIENTPDIINKI